MQKQNVFLKCIFVVTSICTLTPNRVQANNDNLMVPAAFGIACGTLAYVYLKARLFPLHCQLISYPDQTKVKAIGYFEDQEVDPKELDKVINGVAIPGVSIVAGLTAYIGLTACMTALSAHK